MSHAAAFSYLLQTSLAVSVLIGLVLLVRRPFAKAFGQQTAYILWAIPMARLVMPPLPASWTLFGAVELGVLGGASGGAGSDVPLPPALPADPPLLTDIILTETMPLATPAIEDVSVWSQAWGALPPLFPTLLLVWALGTLFVFGRLMQRQITTARLIKAEGRTAGPGLQTLGMDVAQSIGLDQKRVSIQTSFISSGPFVTGLMRPTIMLPAWFEEDYTSEQKRLAMMHEMMHIKRGDLWALLAATFAVALQWFNPLAWVALSRFRIDQEAACDADVLSGFDVSAHAYGDTLVQAVRRTGPLAQPVHAASLPLNHALYERINHMKNPLPSQERRKAGLLLTTSIGAAALIMSAGAVSNAQTGEQAAELDGAASVQAEPEVQVRTIIVSEEQIDSDLAEDGEVARVRIVRRIEGGEAAEGEENVFFFRDGDNASDHGSAVFIGDGGSTETKTEIAELAREFAEEVRRLSAAPGDNHAEIEALRAEFEAKVESLSETMIEDGKDVRIMRFPEGADWTVDLDADQSCEEGKKQTRTVIIDKDGEREERVMTVCGESLHIDSDEILERLRADGRLSEERLAEIEAKLSEAMEKLENLNFKSDFEVDLDIDIDDDEIEED